LGKSFIITDLKKTNKLKIDLIAGARPNFMKIASIIDAIHKAQNKGKDIQYRLIHTGQHYDKNMSFNFFEELGIPQPDLNLGAGGGTQSEQTAAIMIGYEKVLQLEKSNLCLVVGDVNSTMACSIVAQKLHVSVAHVEAGIRSGDWNMPEEINRIVTDSVSNYFFTTTIEAGANLKKIGVPNKNIHLVGNTMIDTLIKHRLRFKKPAIWKKLKLIKNGYLVMTLHRPSNVDNDEKFKSLIDKIIKHSQNLPLIFPMHPRTAKILDRLKLQHERLHSISPLGYLEFNYLVENSRAVITDSGGITEETTVLGIPCMTLRDNTERPETVSIGTNELIGTDPNAIKPAMERLFLGKWKKGAIPDFWDGKTAERIISIIFKIKNELV
jgi:UDP-N-acetylglucosamine 2-epimerase (non-hydrolysing)